jgi:membrane protein YdbS with pleckstrin-like domain
MVQWAVEYLLGWGVVFVVAWGLAAWADGAAWTALPQALVVRVWWLPVVVAVCGGVSVIVAPVWRYRVHRWEASLDVFYTRTGWFSRRWLLVPVSRIQTVDTEQGWLERALGLATLKIATASHAGSSKLAGLPVGMATGLAEDLARRAHDFRDDAT